LQSEDLEGLWSYAEKLPDDMKKAEEYVVKQAATETPAERSRFETAFTERCR
jgi:hypothetical protein